MKIIELSQVAQRNRSDCMQLVFSIQSFNEKPSKTQSSIHLQESQKQSDTVITFCICYTDINGVHVIHISHYTL